MQACRDTIRHHTHRTCRELAGSWPVGPPCQCRAGTTGIRGCCVLSGCKKGGPAAPQEESLAGLTTSCCRVLALTPACAGGPLPSLRGLLHPGTEPGLNSPAVNSFAEKHPEESKGCAAAFPLAQSFVWAGKTTSVHRRRPQCAATCSRMLAGREREQPPGPQESLPQKHLPLSGSEELLEGIPALACPACL